MPKKKKVRDMQQSSRQASQAEFQNEAHRQQNERAAAALLRAQEGLEQREREIALAAAELRRNQQQAVRTAGNVRQHHQINDIGNVDMVNEDDDSLL